jgi:serine/threonine protein kinase
MIATAILPPITPPGSPPSLKISPGKLGEGVTGSVHDTNDPRVVCKKSTGSSKEPSECSLRETSSLTLLKDCPYVPKIISIAVGDQAVAAGDEKGRFCMFIDKYDSDLHEYFTDHKNSIPAHEILWITYCVLRALYDGECLSITHRDVKLQNILISRAATDSKSVATLPTVVLADWGNARFTETLSASNYTNPAQTLWYQAPEVLIDPEGLYSHSINVWSVGIILYEMYAGTHLIYGKDRQDQLTQVFQLFGTPTEATWPGCTELELMKTEIKEHPDGRKYRVASQVTIWPRDEKKFKSLLNAKANIARAIPEKMQDLMLKMLTVSPMQRISISQALAEVCELCLLSPEEGGLGRSEIAILDEIRETYVRCMKSINLMESWQKQSRLLGMEPIATIGDFAASASDSSKVGSVDAATWKKICDYNNEVYPACNRKDIASEFGLYKSYSNKQRVRQVLVQWMMEIAGEFKHDLVKREVIFLACHYLDLLLHSEEWTRHMPVGMIQLMGACCVCLAGKGVSKIAPRLTYYLNHCPDVKNVRLFASMFDLIGQRLGFQFFKVTEFTILRELLQYESTKEHKITAAAAGSKDRLLCDASDLLCCCLMDLNCRKYKPLDLATGALQLARSLSAVATTRTAEEKLVLSLLGYPESLSSSNTRNDISDRVTEMIKKLSAATSKVTSTVIATESKIDVDGKKRKSDHQGQLEIEDSSDDDLEEEEEEEDDDLEEEDEDEDDDLEEEGDDSNSDSD